MRNLWIRRTLAGFIGVTGILCVMGAVILMNQGQLTSTVTDDFKEKRSRFEQYYTFSEPVSDIPSHRFLAIRRGEREGAPEAQEGRACRG